MVHATSMAIEAFHLTHPSGGEHKASFYLPRRIFDPLEPSVYARGQ